MAINVKVPVPAAPALIKGSEALAVLAQMGKDKGRQVWVQGSKVPMPERIPTGWFEFDLATGGGFPRGRISVVYGKESSGKTTVTFKACSTVQKQKRLDNKAVFIDLEGTYDAPWSMRVSGLNADTLIVGKPGYGEECVDIVDAMVRSEDVGLVVLDCVAVMSPTKELDGSAEDKKYGGASIIVGEMIRKILWGFAKESTRGHRPAVILINQPRLSMDTPPRPYLPGGKLQLFESSLTVKVTGKKEISKEIDPLNPAFNAMEWEIRKSKVGVTRTTFNMDMALIDHGNLKVGDTNSWTMVMNTLKSAEQLRKVPQGWNYDGKNYPTLVPIQEAYWANLDFRAKAQAAAVAVAMTSLQLVAANEATDLSEGDIL